MASQGETVKYVIDADTSGFARGMAEADAESEVASKNIDKNLSSTSKSAEGNFKSISDSAKTTTKDVGNFGSALDGFKTVGIVSGVTALSGAVIELAGAFAAAGSTLSLIAPALIEGGAGVLTFKTGISGLSAAFKALQSNNGTAWIAAMKNLSPAAQSVAKSFGTIERAFNSVKANTQQALFAGLGSTLLQVGAQILPILNIGMQQVGQAINGVLKNAESLAQTPLFQGFLASIFQNTAKDITILSQALGPLMTIFAELYQITAPYVTLLAQWLVNVTKLGAAFLSSTKGQSELNLSIQEGILAIEELGKFVGAVFGLLVSVFSTSVNSGDSLISTLTGIIRSTENWVKSAQGQADLIGLFKFTSLALQVVATVAGVAAKIILTIISYISSLSPLVQKLTIGFIALAALGLGPASAAIVKFFGVLQTVGLEMGVAGSIAIAIAAAFIILGAVIRGPLGGALIIVGAAIAAYIGFSFLLAASSSAAGASLFELGFAALEAGTAEADLAEFSVLAASTMYAVAAAGLDAGEGLVAGASGAEILQAALLPLIIAAAGVVVILSMLGVFGSSTKKAQSSTAGFSNSLGGLQKALQGVNAAGGGASNNGLAALNDSLGQTTANANAASGSLASFDKMNVLTSNGGISGLPSLPKLNTPAITPSLNPDAFNNALDGMQKNFDALQKKLSQPITNPFAAIGDWINSHVVPALIIFGTILAVIIAAFAIFGAAAIVAAIGVSLTIGLIVLAVIAVIAIVILLSKYWSDIWAAIQDVVALAVVFLEAAWASIVSAVKAVGDAIGAAFTAAWGVVTAIWGAVTGFFSNLWSAVQIALQVYIAIWVAIFTTAWNAVVAVWNAAVGFFGGLWSGITAIFGGVASFFAGVFSGAWNAVQSAFNNVVGFFSGIWTSIKNIFVSIGSTIGGAVEDAFKSVINGVLSAAQTVINAPINTIDNLIKKINSIPGIPGTLPTLNNITLPRLAQGGIINSPIVAQLGEAGAEAVMPLENNTGWIDQLATKINSSNGNSKGQPIALTVQIGNEKIASKVISLINEKTQMSGRNTILV